MQKTFELSDKRGHKAVITIEGSDESVEYVVSLLKALQVVSSGLDTILLNQKQLAAKASMFVKEIEDLVGK